jgi:hypothetical protein
MDSDREQRRVEVLQSIDERQRDIIARGLAAVPPGLTRGVLAVTQSVSTPVKIR